MEEFLKQAAGQSFSVIILVTGLYFLYKAYMKKEESLDKLREERHNEVLNMQKERTEEKTQIIQLFEQQAKIFDQQSKLAEKQSVILEENTKILRLIEGILQNENDRNKPIKRRDKNAA